MIVIVASIALVLGLALGGLVAWFVAKDRTRKEFADELTRAQGRATTAESSLREVRQQLSATAQELSALREELTRERALNVKAQTSLEAERRNLEEQRKLLGEAESKLRDVFKSLSVDVLTSQANAFLERAEEKLRTWRAQADGDLGKREEAIKAIIEPLKTALDQYDSEIRAVESARQQAYGQLDGQLSNLNAVQAKLQEETAKLVTALRKPQVRGRWGEITLHRLAELSGMVNHCDFYEQETTQTEEGRFRPDMIVRLPAGREIVVDSKAPLDAYLDSVEAATDDIKQGHLVRHAAQVRSHMQLLGSKAYWDRLQHTPEFTVLFLPGDPFLGAAVEKDPTLIEDGMQQRVVIATPSTLIALLLAVYHGWRQEELAKNAQEISDLGKQVYERVWIVWEHLNNLRSSLEKAVDAWNKAVGSLEGRLLPSVRRFKELKATTAEEIQQLEPIDAAVRELPSSPSEEPI